MLIDLVIPSGPCALPPPPFCCCIQLTVTIPRAIKIFFTLRLGNALPSYSIRLYLQHPKAPVSAAAILPGLVGVLGALPEVAGACVRWHISFRRRAWFYVPDHSPPTSSLMAPSLFINSRADSVDLIHRTLCRSQFGKNNRTHTRPFVGECKLLLEMNSADNEACLPTLKLSMHKRNTQGSLGWSETTS